MKLRNRIKSVLIMLLALAMVMSLAACGNKDKPVEDNKPNSVKTTPGDHPEFVYTSSFTGIDGISSYLQPKLRTDEGFYVTARVKVGDNIPEGVTPQYEDQYAVYESRIYVIGNDGKLKRLDGYKPEPAAENTEGKADFYSGSSLSSLNLLPDGNFAVIEYYYASWSEGEYDYKSEQDYYYCVLDKNGNELSKTKIQVGEDEYLSTYSTAMDENGNILMPMDLSVVAIAPDGTRAYSIQTPDYCNSIVKLSDGSVAASFWSEQGMSLGIIDTATKSFGKTIAMPRQAYDPIAGGGDYDLYYTNGINLMGFKMETGESEQVLNWINCDVNGDNIGSFFIDDEGTIVGISNEYDNKKDEYVNSLVTISKVPYESVPYKEPITLAVQYLDWDIRDDIIKFNRTHDDVRIEVIDYEQYNTSEDNEAGLTKLRTEIMSGNMPDILALNGLPYKQLAVKGLLEDLYPYIDSDSELKRSDIFPNVLEALEVDGGLYAASSSFAVNTVIGASSVIGDEMGWTYDELYAALASMPEGCEIFDQYTDQETVLLNCLASEMSNFVDWSTGECKFNSPEFLQMLEFAKQFPGEFDWDNYEWTEEDDIITRISQGKQMLMTTSIYSIEDTFYNSVYFGGDITYIGYPTSSGNGNSLQLNSSFAMSSSCSNKEAAWEFLRTLLTEEGQTDLYSLPTNINVFNDKLEEAMTIEYQTDAQGNIMLDENGEKIPQSRGGIAFEAGEVHEFYALTQEQADMLREAIISSTKLYDSDKSITDIVTEQAQSFFAGQRSAEEVAKLIQSKADIYVNEQR